LNFSYAKKTILTKQKEMKGFTFILAILTALIIFIPFMVQSEGYFIFYGDFNVQQIPFYQMCHKMIREGNISWNWYTDLGSNFIGSYSFYLLGSPFFWLTIPFPNSFVPYLMGPLLILKFGCAAFTAYVYIRRFTRTPQAACIGGLLYAFSGFSVYNIFFNHFHEAIICFPLLLLAMELLLTENKRGVFALAVALCAVVNYFFFFGMVVFAVIYYFVRIFSGAIKFKFSRLLAIVFESVLGVCLAAFLLIPSLYAIMGNSRISDFLIGWSGITYGKEQIYLNIIECFFFPPDIPARPVFFPEADVKWSSLGGWLPVFGMTGVFTLFIEKKGSWMKRVIGICIFMAMVPVLNSAFYAFNTAYYARWFYMPILIMSLATVTLFEDKTIDFSSGLKWATGVTIGFALVIGLFPQRINGKIVFGLYTQDTDLTYVMRFWVTVGISVISLFATLMLLKLRKTSLKDFFVTSVALICTVSIIYSLFFIVCGRSHSYDIKTSVIDDLIEGSVSLEDDTNFRIDTYDGIDNTGMFLELPSINAFHSIVPASVTGFYTYIGVERTVGSRAGTEVPAIRSLLSVKYLLNRTDGESFTNSEGQPKMPGYSYLKTSNGYYIYTNDNYVPYGFSYKYYVTSEYMADLSGDERSRMMLKAILLDQDQIEKYSDCLTNIEDLENNPQNNTDADINETTLLFTDDEMQKDCENLSKTSAKQFDISNGSFTATVEREEKSLVFFSVPYDEGWSATVNGSPVTIEKANKGFMAVLVPSGTSEIKFTYKTPGLNYGIYISLGGLCIFIIYYLIASSIVKRNSGNTEYPEGTKLIDKWHKEEIAETEFNFEDVFEDTYEEMDNEKIPDHSEIKSVFDDEISQNITNNGFSINTDLFDE